MRSPRAGALLAARCSKATRRERRSFDHRVGHRVRRRAPTSFPPLCRQATDAALRGPRATPGPPVSLRIRASRSAGPACALVARSPAVAAAVGGVAADVRPPAVQRVRATGAETDSHLRPLEPGDRRVADAPHHRVGMCPSTRPPPPPRGRRGVLQGPGVLLPARSAPHAERPASGDRRDRPRGVDRHAEQHEDQHVHHHVEKGHDVELADVGAPSEVDATDAGRLPVRFGEHHPLRPHRGRAGSWRHRAALTPQCEEGASEVSGLRPRCQLVHPTVRHVP